MLTKLLILVALPGSGKSYFGNLNTPPDGVFIDDIKDIKQLLEASHLYRVIIMSDPHLCDDKVRAIAATKISQLFPDIEIQWIYWQNQPDRCIINIKDRDDRIISEAFIKKLSASYNPPKVDHPVWSDSFVN